MLQSKRRKQGGFTLIEILVVLVILGILMSIAFVFLGDQGRRARLATAASSVKSAMTIASTCAVVGGTSAVQAPGSSNDPGNSICSGVSQIPDTAVWPKLPDKCHYCGGMPNGTDVHFRCDSLGSSCDALTCDNTSDSCCDFNTAQCLQNN